MLPTHDRQEREQALDQADVGAGPGHELAGLQLVVAGEVEALQPLEDGVAQVVLHVERDPAADEAAHVGGGEPERRASDEQDGQPRPERPVVVHDHVVDDELLDERRQGGQTHADDRHPEGEGDVAPVGGEERPEPADPPA